MASFEHTDAGSADETRSESRGTPFEGCAEWFEKMRECFEKRSAVADCCASMRSACCDQPEAKEKE